MAHICQVLKFCADDTNILACHVLSDSLGVHAWYHKINIFNDIFLFLVAVCGFPGVNLVANYAFQLGAEVRPDVKTFAPGWTLAGLPLTNAAVRASFYPLTTSGLPSNLSDASTTYVASFGSSVDVGANLTQVVNGTVQSCRYNLTFYYSGSQDVGRIFTPNYLNVLVDGTSIAANGNAAGVPVSVPCVDCPDTVSWAAVSSTFTASSTSTVLTFNAANNPYFVFITAVSIVPQGP